MPKCWCESCSPDCPGETYTREHMLKSEARGLLAKPLQYRRDFLAGAEKKRGTQAVNRLKAEMERQQRGSP